MAEKGKARHCYFSFSTPPVPLSSRETLRCKPPSLRHKTITPEGNIPLPRTRAMAPLPNICKSIRERRRRKAWHIAQFHSGPALAKYFKHDSCNFVAWVWHSVGPACTAFSTPYKC